MNANVRPKRDEAVDSVLMLDSPNLWNDQRFRAKLIASAEKDGFDQEVISITRKIFANNDTPDFQTFCAAADRFYGANQLDNGADGRLRGLIDHWRRLREENNSAYRPQSVQDHKARFWPNNPKLLQTNWEFYDDIFATDFFVRPNRFITEKTAIGSAGSCFAANISRQLQYWGYNYVLEMGLSKEHHPDPRNYATDPASCGNIYNVVSMRQMIERAFGEWRPEPMLLSTRKRFVDPFRSISDFTSVEGYLAKRKEHGEALSRALRKCDVFILTLGMTEAWVFGDTGIATSTSPTDADPTLFRHVNLSVDDNVRELERIHDLFSKYRPGMKIITTVSPVPLNATFNKDRHVVVANGLSKSVLRVALEHFSNTHPDSVFYFPAFEIVTYGTAGPWEIDMRHVSNQAVERVMRQFQRQFMVSQEPLPIIGVTPLEEYTPMRRNPALRVLRKWIVHPVKRALGIEGQPFGALFKRRPL